MLRHLCRCMSRTTCRPSELKTSKQQQALMSMPSRARQLCKQFVQGLCPLRVEGNVLTPTLADVAGFNNQRHVLVPSRPAGSNRPAPQAQVAGRRGACVHNCAATWVLAARTADQARRLYAQRSLSSGELCCCLIHSLLRCRMHGCLSVPGSLACHFRHDPGGCSSHTCITQNDASLECRRVFREPAYRRLLCHSCRSRA